MNNMTLTPKIIQNALYYKMPTRKLRYLCKRLIDEGNSNEKILEEFKLFRMNEDIEEIYEDTILDVMDALTGWCSPVFQIMNYGKNKFDLDYDPFSLEELFSSIEPFFDNSNMIRDFDSFITLKEWRWKIFNLIILIPKGFLINYGKLAQWAEEEFSIKISPRNIAWLRMRLYGYFGYQKSIPLHRIAMKNDVFSQKDSDEIQKYSNMFKEEEGIFDNPNWL